MSENINDLISRTNSGDIALLPTGEYEGPIYITKPIKLVGNNTTLWARRGSVIEITCEGAALQGLRVELTEAEASQNAIITHGKAMISDVEIMGAVMGFGEEDGYFDIPRSIDLGTFAAEEKNTFIIKLNVPVACELSCTTAGVSFTPSSLQQGENLVTITVQGFGTGTLLYGEALLRSQFTRRIYITGRPSAEVQPINGKTVYECGNEALQSDVFSVLSPAPSEELPPADIRKGQRISLYQYIKNKCEIHFTHGSPNTAEIDPYVFLLDANGKVFGSKGMVFFGNESSENGSVRYFPDDGHIEIDFEKIDYRVDRILLTYSLYAESVAQSFAEVKSPRCSFVADGKERITYSMYNIGNAPTAIALEFYNYKGEWKVSAEGRGYSGGMAALCNIFGIVADN